MWLSAAMSGSRKGGLAALRWRDIDWPASRIRVRQNYVRGQFGSPKSRRSTERFSPHGPDDLVVAHPATGGPLTKTNITRR
jgi:integrase